MELKQECLNPFLQVFNNAIYVVPRMEPSKETRNTEVCNISDLHIAYTVPSFPQKALNPTTAGDSFCVAFATSRIQGKDELQAIAYVKAEAHQSVKIKGNEPSMPYDGQT